MDDAAKTAPKMTFASAGPIAKSKSIADQAYEQYPRLRSYGFQFMDSRGDPKAGSRKLETYPADETDNPMPGQPTIEQFDPTMTANDFMGETLHILPKVDPYVGHIRQQFIDSMTPDQLSRLQGQYDHAVANEGETRPFDDWKDMSGHDAWFRGHITGQWPKDLYTDEQSQLFGTLQDYLKSTVPMGDVK